VISRFGYQPQLYGFAMRKDAPFAEVLDGALLKRVEDGTLERLQRRWLGTDDESLLR